MIVKNEARVILRCLDSVKNWIDFWVIVDTGSTDGTQRLIGESLKEIPGELYERPWVDFEWNRNEALDLARLSRAEYSLFIDADDELVYGEGFCLPLLDKDCYYAIRQIKEGALEVDSCWVLLVRNALPWKWHGAIHEEIRSPQSKTFERLPGLVVRFNQDGNRSQDPKKALGDVELLKRAIKKESRNSRSVFYLAEAYKALSEFHLAIPLYERVAKMEGADPEEVYWSLYWIGALQRQLKLEPSLFQASYYRCYLNRPTRAEPLCDWANFYLNEGNYLMGYLLSEFALSLNGPDSICCKKWIYDWALLLQYYTCCDRLGKKGEADRALSTLLSNRNLPSDLRFELEKEKR